MIELAALKAEAQPVLLSPGKWNKQTREWLGKLPDHEVSRLTGKKLKTVTQMRVRMGIKRVKQPALSDSEKSDLRAQYSTGTADQYELAVRFGVNKATVSRVVNRSLYGQRRYRDCDDLKSETIAELGRAWQKACANGSREFFGVWTRAVNAGYRIVWRDTQARRKGVLCTAASWQDLDEISLAVWRWLDERRHPQRMIDFPAQRTA